MKKHRKKSKGEHALLIANQIRNKGKAKNVIQTTKAKGQAIRLNPCILTPKRIPKGILIQMKRLNPYNIRELRQILKEGVYLRPQLTETPFL